MDRAALDVALEFDLPCGGWCPQGRRAEDGPIPARYPLCETGTDRYPERTRLNVCDSDGTLILTRGEPDRGTALTLRLARAHGRPVLVIDLTEPTELDSVRSWLEKNAIAILNIAGPRASSSPGIYEEARAFLGQLLAGSQEP